MSKSFTNIDEIICNFPENIQQDIRMYSHPTLKYEVKTEINKNKTKLKNTKNPDCVCHLERWCEECYGDFDLFD